MYSCGKKSFTLSEVLITLVVIGIITAITVPVVMANINQEQYKAALRKNYTTLSNAFNLAYGYNYDDFRDWELENNVLEMTKDVFDRISGYLQISKICGSGAKRDECWAEKTNAKNRAYAHWFTNAGKGTGGVVNHIVLY